MFDCQKYPVFRDVINYNYAKSNEKKSTNVFLIHSPYKMLVNTFRQTPFSNNNKKITKLKTKRQ